MEENNKDIEEIKEKSKDEKIDELESIMANNFEIINCPLNHRFTDGLYVREIFMPAGSLVTSKIHKTQHQYFILKGAVSVWIDEGKEVYLEAPYIGVTEPGTRRVLYIWEDCIWATAHANPENENEEEIEERIIEKHDNPLLSQDLKDKLKEINSSNSKKIDSVNNKKITL
jgi:predicted small metal-binding protein/mannose-6-phosphate isomerase-like protein (cupin superfamily)